MNDMFGLARTFVTWDSKQTSLENRGFGESLLQIELHNILVIIQLIYFVLKKLPTVK